MRKRLVVNLIDMDRDNRTRTEFPNLALMKLSAWHKDKGDSVTLGFPLREADVTYASCVFTWHKSRIQTVPNEAQFGGSGLGLDAVLPSEVEHYMPDYDLYAGVDFSMGFTSRGCCRNCPWCLVPRKEGCITPWASPREFYDSRRSRLLLLDNNLLAAPNWRDTLVECSRLSVEVDYNQGLDIRLIDDEKAFLLKKVRSRQIRFAFDSLDYEYAVRSGISLLLRAGFRSRELSFYVLVGYGHDDTWLERMKLLASLNVDVFPMVYRDSEGREGSVDRVAVPEVFWHGGRRNINRFLRVVGRLSGV